MWATANVHTLAAQNALLGGGTTELRRIWRVVFFFLVDCVA